MHGEFGADGAGIGERQADGEAGANRRLVDGIEQQRVVLPGDDDLREFNLRAAGSPPDTVDGQVRQPQAEDTPPARLIGTHHISIP
jgi:hypothetical protein